MADSWLEYLKQSKQQEKLLSDTNDELTKAAKALALKTRDLNTFKSISKAEIDRLKKVVSTESGHHADNLPNSTQVTIKSDLGDVDLSETNEHPLDERRQETRREDEKTAEKMASLAIANEIAAQKKASQSNEYIEEVGSTNDFFNADFSAGEGNEEFFKPTEGFTADKELLKNQERVIVKLVEKSRQLETEVEALKETNSDLLLAANTKLKTEVGVEEVKSVNKIAIMVGQLKNAQSALLSREQELDKLEQKMTDQFIEIEKLTQQLEASQGLSEEAEQSKLQIDELKGRLAQSEQKSKEMEPQLVKVSQLTRKLQQADKLNAKLQVETLEIRLLKTQLSQFEDAAIQHEELDTKLSRMSQQLLNSEEQNITLQNNSVKLHAKITELKQKVVELETKIEQQAAARVIFEKNNVDIKHSLKQEIEKSESLGKELVQYQGEIVKLHEANSTLAEESLESQKYADQLDTLNLHLNEESKKQKEAIQFYGKKEADLERAIEGQRAANQELELDSIEKNKTIELNSAVIVDLKNKIDESERVKRYQHSTIEQLKLKVIEIENQILVKEKRTTNREKQFIELAERLADSEKQIYIKTTQVSDLERNVSQTGELVSLRNKQRTDQLNLIADLEKQILDRKKKMEAQAQASAELERAYQENKKLIEQKTVITTLLSNRVTSLTQLATKNQVVEPATGLPIEERSEPKRKESNSNKKSKSEATVGSNVAPIKKPCDSKQVQVIDDLKLIRGVGPKLERLLHENNITTFKQIAELDKTAVHELSNALGSLGNRIRRDNWIGSAKKLLKQQLKKAA